MRKLEDSVREVLGEGVKPGDLSLSGLSRPNIDWSGSREEIERKKVVKEEYKKKYGKDWMVRYFTDKGLLLDGSYDDNVKFVNGCICFGTSPGVTDDGEALKRILNLWEERLQYLFGTEFEKWRIHQNDDPYVVEALLQDAIKTGKWKELPDHLQDEYHRRAGEKK